MVNMEHSRDRFTSPPDIGSDNIVIGPSAQIHPHINHQATPLPHRRPNSVSFSYFVCRMASPNLSSLSHWLLQAHYIDPAFDSRLQRRNGPLQ
jgi:hypothetical protein